MLLFWAILSKWSSWWWGGFWSNILPILVVNEIEIRILTRLWREVWRLDFRMHQIGREAWAYTVNSSSFRYAYDLIWLMNIIISGYRGQIILFGGHKLYFSDYKYTSSAIYFSSLFSLDQPLSDGKQKLSFYIWTKNIFDQTAKTELKISWLIVM